MKYAGSLLALLLTASSAHAHFRLEAPASYGQQDTLGSPQKMAPCGGSGVVETGDVTQIPTGATITIVIDETVYHPGHYRVLLAPDLASLPPDPMVTPDSRTACGTLAIDPNPQLPLIADGVLLHSSKFAGPQRAEVTLPAGMECRNCVLQIVEFMHNHGAPCFYHHCAMVDVFDDAPALPDAGPLPDGGGGDPVDDGGGCCSSSGGGESCLGAIGIAFVLRARRAARRSRRAFRS